VIPPIFARFMEVSAANTTGSAVASMLIYILMAVVLLVRPQGLFGARG
jgi:branched-chain amino acid transport system permease protein